MSLITGCPACGTMFKVVADQLKISDGWVRCGHCSQVFDATANMVPVAAAPFEAAARDAGREDNTRREQALAQAEAEREAEARRDAESRDAEARRYADAQREAQALAEAESAARREAEALREAEAEREAEARREAGLASEAAARRDAEARREAEASEDAASLREAEALFEEEARSHAVADAASAQPEPQAAPAPLPVFGPSQLEQARRDAAEADAQLQQISFVRQAQRRAFWASPVVRGLMLLLVLGLAALLALQYAVYDRNRLAALQPALKPRLQLLCAWLQCTVDAPRQIDAVAIDSSGFNKLRNDSYRLAFTLKNSANMTVAKPAMELTLTDSQDQPLLRRVLLPEELDNASPVLAANGEWSVSVALSVAPLASGARIAGYRLLAFYP